MKLRNIQDGYGWFGHGKKLDKLVTQKDCGIVKDWKKSIINHMYWCASSTPVGEGAVMLAKWNSLPNYLLNKHTDHDDALFPECLLMTFQLQGERRNG